MNRILVLGVAMFFALVGLAMVGGESQAVAGHGCNGCKGVGCVGGGDCGGVAMDCCGKRVRCAGRMHARKARCGGLRKHRRGCGGCSGMVECGGGKVMMDAPVKGGGDVAPTPPPAPTVDQGASFERSPLLVRRISFRR